MKKPFAIFAFLLLATNFQSLTAAAQESIAGRWQGVAVKQGVELPLEIDFSSDVTGLKGAITIRQLGGLEIPLKGVVYKSPDLLFELPTDAGNFSFKGTVRGDALNGSWNLFGFESEVSLRRSAAQPLPYTQEEVSCRNSRVTLAATLLLPKTKAIHPALVFLHGSGATKRDINRFLADHFARQGFAALIFDKRGTGASTGNWRQADFNNLARDALACMRLLKSRRNVDPKRIGLIGASQAGWVAPLAASLSRDVSFMIIVSGPVLTAAQEGLWEAELKLRQRGFSLDEIEKALALLKQDDEVTRTGKGLGQLKAAFERAKGERWLSSLDFGTPLPIAHPSRLWFRRVMDYTAVPALGKLSIPSLWIYGGRDQTVPAMESAAILESLKARGKDITIKIFPTANHQMYVMPEPGQAFRWFGYAPGYLETIDEWLSKRVRAGR